MSRPVHVRLEPLGETITLVEGKRLRDALFARGVEFPCGGEGRCRGCGVRVLAEVPRPGAEEAELFSASELDDGWRLGCRLRARDGSVLELAACSPELLQDGHRLPALAEQDGLGIAIDLGTTTVAAQLLDLRTGRVIASEAGLNPQATFGADVMSRLDAARSAAGRQQLTACIRDHLAAVVARLLTQASPAVGALRVAVVVGNTAMRDLASGVAIDGLLRVPFEPGDRSWREFRGADLGWCAPDVAVHFLPPVGGFVGSDALAGALTVGLGAAGRAGALIDLGTNGEILVAIGGRLLCVSTAAGPAFEGARIRFGMRAATGAIHRVVPGDALRCSVLGGGAARGICGSGLVDAVAAALKAGLLRPDGRLIGGDALPLCGPVVLTQADVREVQLAKAAIAAGLETVLEQGGTRVTELERVDLAGAFGTQIDPQSARRIGLWPPLRIQPRSVGNAALRGAKTVLLAGQAGFAAYGDLLERSTHLALGDAPTFQDRFVEAMGFPS